MFIPYEYQSLPDEDSIRILILAPGRGDVALAGELEVVRLSNRRDSPVSAGRALTRRKTASQAEVTRWTSGIPYEAISYVWGSEKKDQTFFLGRKTLQITENLSDALRQCRLPDRPRFLWADSICINQDNKEEKNHQVYMMGRIYASSQRTLICLGTDPDIRHHARDASDLIEDTNGMIERAFDYPGFSWKVDSFPKPLPNDPHGNDSRWKSVDILLNHPWFARGWVVQEAALGRDAQILWAGCNIPLLNLLRVDLWYNRRMQDLVEKPRETKIPHLLRHILFHVRKAESEVFAVTEGDTHRPSILHALSLARGLGLSDPRDRVYAFMALPFVKNPMPPLRPDYQQSHLELYQCFAINYLEKTSDLNLLCYATHKKADGISLGDDLPTSWIPRWDRERWDPGHVRNGNFGQMSERLAEFKILMGDDGAPALEVRAVIFDSIRLVSRQFQDSMTIEDLAGVWSKLTFQNSFGSRHNGSNSADILGLTLLRALSKGYLGAATSEHWAIALKSYSSLLQRLSTSFISHINTSPDIRSCHRTLMTLAHDSHIFMLERGHHGLGPWGIKQGDVCAFVFGVNRPLILRKIPGIPGQRACSYKVVGPAFVVSKSLNTLGLPLGLNQQAGWENCDEFWRTEGWRTLGLKQDMIILQ